MLLIEGPQEDHMQNFFATQQIDNNKNINVKRTPNFHT